MISINNMDFLFNIIALVHVLIWAFVLLAFLNIKTAKINLYFVIPLIYLIHCAPFHILIQLKLRLSNNDDKVLEHKQNNFSRQLILPYLFVKIQEYLDKKCTFNPISPQGMLLFGMITCLYRVYPL